MSAPASFEVPALACHQMTFLVLVSRMQASFACCSVTPETGRSLSAVAPCALLAKEDPRSGRIACQLYRTANHQGFCCLDRLPASAYLTALPLLCGSLDFTALLTGRFAMAGRRERGLELTGGGAAAGIRGGRRAALHALRDRQLAPQPAAQRRPA